MAKDRLSPCIYYTNCGGTCMKGFKDVTLKRCKNCPKYKPRKGLRRESIKDKRQKDKDRHDSW